MPKINVYLPEDLAASVRRAGVPVSPVCQQALAEAVRKVARIRKVVDIVRNQALSPEQMAKMGSASGITDRLRSAIQLADQRAAEAGTKVTTGQLLLGLLDEGGNFAISLLQSLDVDLDDLRSSIESGRPADAEAGEPRVADDGGDGGNGGDGSVWRNLSWPAWNAVAAAMEAAIDFGHNYVGCEHLLIGLFAGPDDQAGQVLRGHGVESASLRRALTSAVAGFTHGRQAAGSIAEQLDRIVSRLDGIEQRLAAIGA
jgi:ATP-dependent Clp protease ATP-binding subunit ClpA